MGKGMVEVVNQQAIAKFNERTQGEQTDYKTLQAQHAEIIKKIDRLEERYIEEEIGSELYNKYRVRYKGGKEEIEKNLMKLSRQVSNLDGGVGFAMKLALELPLKWVSANYNTKKRIQFLLFPEGITYSKKTDECRTPRINSIFAYVAYFQQIEIKKEAYQNQDWILPLLQLW
ncbi:hypothetical protein [Sphingobacterium hotanense]|uniref:hypothetical protein n=1 Tax=Sphingobacterium hotanense TaxID=649196 RepID=UPI0021A52C0E|nr:hypothetical protein [Sphingobacterium hotanense]MCT1523791.1 hypothetical protein [Sphingobacterium hotanense]